VLERIRERLHSEVDSDNRFLSWDEVRELTRYGFEIGAHTVSHPILPNTDPAEVDLELSSSRRVLEEQLGVAPTLFSYPNGATTPEVTAAAGRYFEAAVTTTPGVCTPFTPLLELPRVGAPTEVADLGFELTRQLFRSGGTDLHEWAPVPRAGSEG
jgi:peptidoglycan/xylan/chitin deacetylase (PgdA/CDA1 family)